MLNSSLFKPAPPEFKDRLEREYFSKRLITAVVVGGGSGLGAYLALELAKIKSQEEASKSDLHVIIVARTAPSAQATLSELQRCCPTGRYELVYCKDLAILAQVRETVDCIKTVLQNWQNRGEEDIELDYLFMTQGQVEFRNAPISEHFERWRGQHSRLTLQP